MKTRLKQFLTGLTIPQEYVCLGYEELTNPLHVFLTTRKNSDSKDITATHIFLGYKPLVIALVFPASEQEKNSDSEICLSFSPNQFSVNTRWKGFPADRNSIARLQLKKTGSKKLENHCVVFYEGVQGRHKFISGINQAFDSLLSLFKGKPAFNISLDGNLHDQVRIAYSVARKISLVTVSEGELINIFPTDLHGAVGNNHYISSLRSDGKACSQVEANRKIVISEIDAAQFKMAYGLGKNHMKHPAARHTFELAEKLSHTFQFPLPKGTTFYRELELTDTFDAGIHRLLIYKLVYAEKVKSITSLAHVHQYYAQWRQDNRAALNPLLR